MKYDFVYILKESETNSELPFSLRSIEKYLSSYINNIFIVGYKPSWLKNVEYIPTIQGSNKWKNSTSNVVQACKSNLISDDFILMNDDFFCCRETSDLENSLNVCMGTVQNRINYSNKLEKPSEWYKAFSKNKVLLDELNIGHEYFDYEIHSPIVLNKFNFLEMINNPNVMDFCKSNNIFLKRTIYNNIFNNSIPKKVPDYKIKYKCDLAQDYNRDWISVYDNVVNVDSYKNLNTYLNNNLNQKSSFEI
jgi:hypothetical protein